MTEFSLHTNCLLCEHTADLKYDKHIGYQADKSFAIYHCSNCMTAFALPMKVDEQVYNNIYQNSKNISGYDRYLRYADEVLLQSNPLEYLANEEDVYWAIKTHLSSLRRSNIKILEVGCGLGYLTYALRKTGYDATGIDISQTAVNQAKERYGEDYICQDVKKYAQKVGPIYDLIIFTEVIEHIPDIKPFISALGHLLTPNGELILTTPNRSSYPLHVLWETEPPPVHLWWFSECSIEKLAKDLGYGVHFIDFTEYNKEPLTIIDYKNPYKPTRLPRLDRQGKVIDYHAEQRLHDKKMQEQREIEQKKLNYKLKESIKYVLKQIHLLKPLQKIKLLFKPPSSLTMHKVDLRRRYPLCAILNKSEI